MLRPLTRKDLPKKTGIDSLHIPIVYKGKLRFVCDISYGSNELCWLEDNDGIPVLIKDCELITDYKLYRKVIQKLHPPIPADEYGRRNEDRVMASIMALQVTAVLKNKNKQP